jgi:ABC-type phosphate/phosphonate transport system substrate-binding protein
MTETRRIGIGALLVALGIGVALGPGLLKAEKNVKQPTIKIGMVSSLFRNVPQALITASMGPFKILMEAQTGLPGELVQGGDAIVLGQDLGADKVHLGVFQGFEFAWAQKRFPDLRPLMIAVNQHAHLHVHVLVAKNSEASQLPDLKGKTLALPTRTPGHCLLYLERKLKIPASGLPKYFGAVTATHTVEDALDDVVDGAVQATVVDAASLECYKRRKPARFAKLRCLEKSGVFPAAVVAYHAGALDEETLRKFQVGMQNANKSAFGRQLLTLWQITGFETIPVDYQQTLTEVAKAYPAPDELEAKN